MNSTPIQKTFHYCPQCATPNPDVGSIPFRCPACELKLFFGPVSAVGGLVVNDRDELLLVRRAKDPGCGKWGLPGGFVDRGETIEDALRREVREETNLEIRDLRYLMSQPNQYAWGGATAPVTDLFFECHVESLESLSLCKDELASHAWVRPTAKYLENMAFPSNRIAVEAWLETNASE